MQLWIAIICIVAAVLIGGAAGIFLGITIRKNTAEKEIGSAEEEARKMLIENIKNGRDMMQLSNEELEEIALLESELASICEYSETAKHILQGRKFNKSRELENKITQGRRLSELTLEELGKLKEI